MADITISVAPAATDHKKNRAAMSRSRQDARLSSACEPPSSSRAPPAGGGGPAAFIGRTNLTAAPSLELQFVVYEGKEVSTELLKEPRRHGAQCVLLAWALSLTAFCLDERLIFLKLQASSCNILAAGDKRCCVGVRSVAHILSAQIGNLMRQEQPEASRVSLKLDIELETFSDLNRRPYAQERQVCQPCEQPNLQTWQNLYVKPKALA